MRCLLIITLIVTIFSCHKHPDLPYRPVQVCTDISSNVDSVNKYIHGRWNWLEEKRWVRTTFSFEYITPQTTGYIQNIKIVDSTIILYRNYFIEDKRNFKVVKESDLYPGGDNSAYFVFLDPKTNLVTNEVPITACSEFLIFHFEVISDFSGAFTYKKIN